MKYTLKIGFNSRLREEATTHSFFPSTSCAGFNSRLREEATHREHPHPRVVPVSTHASVRRRQEKATTKTPTTKFQLTPP